MTYDNSFFKLPPSGTLDGMKRTRLLKDMQCKIGEVWDEDEAVYVAFAAEGLPHATCSISNLRKDGLYV